MRWTLRGRAVDLLMLAIVLGAAAYMLVWRHIPLGDLWRSLHHV